MDGTQDQNMQSFVPTADTTRDLRNALGRFATGVTVITAQNANGDPVGITANSFASVSLDPALVLWSPAKTSSRYDVFMQAKHFAIHVMNDTQSDLCKAFVGDAHAFEGLDTEQNAENVTLINGCLARFECSMEAAHDAGDHSIIVGRVTRVSVGTGDPLLFASGQFGKFDAS